MRFLPVNLDALLVELDDLPQSLALFASLQADPVAGVVELVPAARTLLVRYAPETVTHDALVERIRHRRPAGQGDANGPRVEIPVDYRGEDLDEVAALLGIPRDELIRRHTGSDYTVAFCGFAPGFAYLSGGDPRLNVPRRATPRTRVPAGSVALAGAFSGVYPQASPGGWQILGSTALAMWDLGRPEPALLRPGFRVRFVDETGHATGRTDAAALPAAQPASGEPPRELGPGTLRVRRIGLQALFQDAGRPGHAGQGVSTSGAMDRASLRRANRRVGNPVDAACVEIACGGAEFEARGTVTLAVTGADVTLQLLPNHGPAFELPRDQAIALDDGDGLRIGAPRAGARSYLAVRGGFAAAPVLGSRSTDTLARLGPHPLAVGDVLPIHRIERGGVIEPPEPAPAGLPRPEEVVTLDIALGPRTDWFRPESVDGLANQVWRITPQSDRVGLRLHGDRPLVRLDSAELPSEGTVHGAIQVPPSGQPVLFLADHPLTGGYPVIGAVAPHHHDLAGQIPIGAGVRFRPIRPFFETRDA